MINGNILVEEYVISIRYQVFSLHPPPPRELQLQVVIHIQEQKVKALVGRMNWPEREYDVALPTILIQSCSQ